MKKVVVIGGGFCGCRCAKNLEKYKNFKVTLIDNKPYFEFTPGILRTIVNPEHKSKIQVMHKDYLKNSEIIVGNITELQSSYIKIKENKKKINFDYLVIASGSSYSAPIKESGLISAARAKELVKYHKELASSKKIAIIGGGLVGVELAAEIITAYIGKEVTIINSGQRLISRNHPKSIEYAHKFLTKRGVKIIPNQKVSSSSQKICVTNNGGKIKCDMIFSCIGITPNSDFMRNNFQSSLDEKGYIRVNDFLQLPSNENIFVGGDITSIIEEKTAQTAEKHADLIVKNILNLENNFLLVKYKPRKRPMIISLGKTNGIYEYKDFVMTGFIPAIMKWAVERKTMLRYK